MRTPTFRRLGIAALAVAVVALAAAPAFAYCLTGVKWGADTRVYYNSSGKVTTGQCISSSQMNSTVTGQITTCKALLNGGNTGARANRRDGQNTIGWAKLGGQTLGVTNYLSYGSPILTCGSNSFQSLFEADVRLTTSYRWTNGSGGCPCAAGSAIYLNGVAQHELGHVIGLCHTNQPNDLMYPSFGVCENKSKGSDETAGENALCY